MRSFPLLCSADGTSPVYIKYNPILHGGLAADEVAPGGGGITRAPPRLLSLDFVRKYLHFVKSAVQPTLTSRARAAVVDAYNGFRQRVAGRATLITARSLETIIRLASAHAKLRLQPSVMVTDVDVATRIMTYALYGEESSVPYSGGGDGAKAATAVLPARPLTPARQHGGPRADAVVGGNGGVHGGQDAGGAAVGGASGGLPDVSGNHDDDDGGIVSHDGPRAAGVPSDAALYGVTDEAVAAAFSAAGPAAGAAVDVAGADHLAVRRALTRLATSRGGEVPLGAELASVLARDAAPQALLSDRDGLLRWLAAHLHALVIDGKVVVADGVVVIV